MKKKTKSFSERVDKALKKLAAATDESTESVSGPAREVQANPSRKPTVPGGAPGPLSPEEIASDPNIAVNKDILDEMGAKTKFAMDHDQAVKTWDSITQGATHKITKCMESVQGKVDDPGAYCKFLAEQAGYDPNA